MIAPYLTESSQSKNLHYNTIMPQNYNSSGVYYASFEHPNDKNYLSL